MQHVNLCRNYHYITCCLYVSVMHSRVERIILQSCAILESTLCSGWSTEKLFTVRIRDVLWTQLWFSGYNCEWLSYNCHLSSTLPMVIVIRSLLSFSHKLIFWLSDDCMMMIIGTWKLLWWSSCYTRQLLSIIIYKIIVNNANRKGIHSNCEDLQKPIAFFFTMAML